MFPVGKTFSRCLLLFPASVSNLAILNNQKTSRSMVVMDRTLCMSCPLNAGQGKKEIKSAKDHTRSKVFTGLTRRIQIAVKEGGSNDPKQNSQLAQVLKLCKKTNVPTASIKRALSSINSLENEFLMAVSGPRGSTILVTCSASSSAEAKYGLAYAIGISNIDGKLDQETQNEFAKKWVIITSMGGKEVDEDKATEIALTVGAEDVRILEDDEENLLEFICDTAGYKEVEKELTTITEDLTILSSKLEHIPLYPPVHLNERDLTAVKLFIQALHKRTAKVEIKFNFLDISHNINNLTTTFDN